MSAISAMNSFFGTRTRPASLYTVLSFRMDEGSECGPGDACAPAMQDCSGLTRDKLLEVKRKVE